MFYLYTSFTDWNRMEHLAHHGIKGQKWGIRNGPPYPLDHKDDVKIRMKGINGHYGDPSSKKKDSSHRFHHDKETLETLERLPKNADMEKIRDSINHPDDEGIYHDVGRDYNCPCCACAFEMVERGYNVRARTAPDGSNVGDITRFFKNGKLNNSKAEFDESFLEEPYPTIPIESWNKARFGFQKKRLSSKEWRMQQKYEAKVMAYQDASIKKLLGDLHEQGENARGILVVGWRLEHDLQKRTTAFHALNYKIENGQLLFYDTQSSREWKQNGYSGTTWMYGCDPREFYYMRTDNIDVSKNITRAVYSYRGGK